MSSKSNKGIVKEILWVGFIPLLLFFLIFPPFSFTKYIAWYNSKNPENILEGCLYYLGESNKNSARGGFYRMRIEKFRVNHDLNISSIHSPIANDDKRRERFFRKISQENQPKRKCYKVKYVTGRFSYSKRAYLYDIIE